MSNMFSLLLKIVVKSRRVGHNGRTFCIKGSSGPESTTHQVYVISAMHTWRSVIRGHIIECGLN